MDDLQIPNDLALDYAVACNQVTHLEGLWLTSPETLEERLRWMSAMREKARDERIASLTTERETLNHEMQNLLNIREENAKLKAQVEALSAPISTSERMACVALNPVIDRYVLNVFDGILLTRRAAAQKAGK
jgi:hypothetical protein